MAKQEKKLLEAGFKKRPVCIHMSQVDNSVSSGRRSLSYDVWDTFTYDQMLELRRWVDEVNARFPDIKMFITGGDYYKELEIPEDDGNN